MFFWKISLLFFIHRKFHNAMSNHSIKVHSQDLPGFKWYFYHILKSFHFILIRKNCCTINCEFHKFRNGKFCEFIIADIQQTISYLPKVFFFSLQPRIVMSKANFLTRNCSRSCRWWPFEINRKRERRFQEKSTRVC